MNEFRSSNGATVARHVDSVDIRRGDAGEWLEPWEVVAIREWVIAEEDDRLGRWRWPESPNYVMYPDEDGDVMVLDEKNPGVHFYARVSTVATISSERARAAQAYFDAHPQPKPWHNAKPGEVWALKFGVSDEEELVQAKDSFFVNLAIAERWFDTTGKKAPEITAGRRIYPEGDS